MSNISSIYLDEASTLALKKRKERMADFNLSAFVQGKLLEDDLKEQNPDELMAVINSKKNAVALEKNAIDILEDKHRKLVLEIETKKREEEQARIDADRKKVERVKTFANSIMDLFEVDMTTAMLLAEEFLPMREQRGISIYDFMEGRGYKDKVEEK